MRREVRSRDLVCVLTVLKKSWRIMEGMRRAESTCKRGAMES